MLIFYPTKFDFFSEGTIAFYLEIVYSIVALRRINAGETKERRTEGCVKNGEDLNRVFGSAR